MSFPYQPSPRKKTRRLLHFRLGRGIRFWERHRDGAASHRSATHAHLHAVGSAARLSAWHRSRRRRVMDCCLATAAVGLLSPLLLLIAILVRLTSTGPAIFRQTRVGIGGTDFTILKFRTMRCDSESVHRPAAGDDRVTPLGRLLRRHKFDELPQLLHVITGKMSLVGPRPKLRDHHSANWQLRPGITGAASVAFAAEEALLREVPADQLELCHRDIITPHKVALDLQYAENATFRSDLRLLFMTLLRFGRYTSTAQVPGWPNTGPRPGIVTARSRPASQLRTEAALWPLAPETAEGSQIARKVNGRSW